jgi:hypothetical protein
MQRVQARQRLAEFFGLKQNLVALLAMVILVGLGEKMAERFLPLYLMALGGGSFSIGVLNGVDNLLSALYAFPGGYASDKLGYKRTLFLFNVMAMAGYAKDGKCSFEAIIERHGLTDPALFRLATIVHAADIATDLHTDEIAPGLKAIAVGYSLRFPDDTENLRRQFAVHEALYAWCRLHVAKPG